MISRLEGCVPHPICRLDLPRTDKREQFEDPRLFIHRGKIHMSYVEGCYGPVERVTQKLAVLSDDWKIERIVTVEFGDNGFGTEKNWQFFTRGHRLYFVYSIAPHVTVELSKAYKVLRRWKPGPKIPFLGLLRGGTPPQHTGNSFQAFVHFHTEHFTRHRRYGVCSYRFRDYPPFDVCSLSEVLLRGSEEDLTITNTEHPDWDPLVIFPCGIVRRRDHWLVSAGVNDSTDVLLKLPLNIPHKLI